MSAGEVPAWMDYARCHDYELNTFFPEPGRGRSIGAAVNRAIAICNQCPVRQPCLEYALDNHIRHGVWGGESERGRARIQAGRARQRRAAQPPPRVDNHLPNPNAPFAQLVVIADACEPPQHQRFKGTAA
jgi:WhiB family redox-sensing transcriptional regulator